MNILSLIGRDKECFTDDITRHEKNSFKTFLAIFVFKLITMVTTIKRGTSREKIMDVLKKRKVKAKGIDLEKYCGSISLKEDPLEMQKKWRNEWE